MIKKTTIILVASCVVSSTFASSLTDLFFHKKQNVIHKNAPQSQEQKEHPNFSGQWEGTCNNAPSIPISLSIDQSADGIRINEEVFTFGALNSAGEANNTEAWSYRAETHWSVDGTSLIINGNSTEAPFGWSLNSFLSQLTLKINNNQLNITSMSKEFEALTETDSSTLQCVFDKIK